MAKRTKADPAAHRSDSLPASAETVSGKSPQGKSGPFPIVGIGASAGGLAALKAFFAHVPEDTGLAYVVVVHPSPEHKSHLAELLQPHVKMPVQQVTDTVALERNHVYVIPPNANLNTIDTHLRLSKLEEEREHRAPIDHFFRTLAQTHDGDAIGVLLTGTGRDGTLGLREIKDHGGLTLAQDPNEADSDGMPQSAISMEMVDRILPVAEIPEAVVQFARSRPILPVIAERKQVDSDKEKRQRTSAEVPPQKQNELDLVDSKDRYRALFNLLDEGFCVVEVTFDELERAVDYRFLEANPAFCQQTGIEDPIGRTMRGIAPDHEEYWFETYGEIAKTGQPKRFERPANALGFYYDVFAFRVGEPGERKVAVLFRDITDQKRAEESLKEADRRKDEFLATLAHELRNPLAPICTALEVMRMADDKAAIFSEIYDTLTRQTQQLVRLIDDLLDVSRIARGKLELRKSVIRLSDVVEAAAEESQPLIDEEGHDLSISIPVGPIYLDADPHRLAQVLSNLLNNAAKYTPPGGRIELSARKDKSEVLLTVKDNGLGIPPEMQDNVFEIFRQVHRSTEHDSAGLGIGLSLVKSLVEFHAGTIELQSDGHGQGTEFRIRLPILTNPPETLDVPAAPEEPVIFHSARRVLVVDDNKTIRELSKRMIEMLGHTVRTAGDGEEALVTAKEFRPHIILMDLGMPKMDGCEAARRIRHEEWGRQIILVALSGWGQERDKQKSEQAGFDHHLVKPAAPEDIKRLIAQADDRSI